MAKPTPLRPLAPDWFARARLKLRHLQLLVALDELRNLNRAAQSLGLTQPAASRLLAEVEQMVGGAVFERRPRGVEPNALGEVLLRRAVEAMQRDTPGLQVTVEVEPSARLIEGLRRGRLDLALARIPAGVQAGELDYREVGEEELCFLVQDAHPLLGRERIGLADLLGFTWLLEPAGSLLRQAVEMLFARHGLPMPGRVINTASILLNLAALGRSDAVSVVSAPVAAMLGAQGRFRRLPPLREAEFFAVSPYGLIRMRDRPLSPAAARLQAVLEPMLFGDRDTGLVMPKG